MGSCSLPSRLPQHLIAMESSSPSSSSSGAQRLSLRNVSAGREALAAGGGIIEEEEEEDGIGATVALILLFVPS
ncbi:hypothetical protein JOB18_038210 [Solea senegalensis]|uniref:Uncharacterized protein n=1 Tax=Solea senegalensis TaxID=28829 RepID=A0AAV6QYM7_SOLSE|nr:hypothetical protein JOB18_038210 [Solea senegalensis]KAG7497469.1 hypothetical protein JOB18_038210 [Solea senegalensis]